MIDVASLRAEMTRYGITQKQLAESIGISPRTFSNKMKKGVFRSDEIEQMIQILKIKDPMSIFFAQMVTLKNTKLKGDYNNERNCPEG